MFPNPQTLAPAMLGWEIAASGLMKDPILIEAFDLSSSMALIHLSGGIAHPLFWSRTK
jgi:hypothetical protein